MVQHPRSTHEYKHTTNPLHMPDAIGSTGHGHRNALSSRKTYGPSTGRVVESMLKAKPHRNWLIVQFWGCWHFRKKYGPERLEKACYVALHYNALTGRFIDNLLRHYRENGELPLSRRDEQHPAYMLQSMKTCVVRATTTDRRNNSMSDNLLNKLTQLKLPAMAGA